MCLRDTILVPYVHGSLSFQNSKQPVLKYTFGVSTCKMQHVLIKEVRKYCGIDIGKLLFDTESDVITT